MRPYAVVDTNVVVAGLLTADLASPVAVVVDGMLAGRIAFLLSPWLVTEYRAVLLRPRIRRRHRLTPERIEGIILDLMLEAAWREPGIGPDGLGARGESAAAGPRADVDYVVSETAPETAPDPGDTHLWDLLRTSPGSVLVTGDALLIERPPSFASVMSPRTFVAWLAEGEGT